MNLSPAPRTPIRTPQPGSSAKTLQLTPVWEEVVKNERLPTDVDQDSIFKEISQRLEDLEWPVRQHALRVLCDVIPVVPDDLLDERVIANNILSKLVVNLGHPAPGIRKVALETIQKYLKKTSQSEKMLEDFIRYGVREKDSATNDPSGILRENVTLGTIISLVDVLKPFIVPENGGYSISQSFLAEILEALSGKAKNPLYREKCVETIWKLRDMVGECRFQQTIKNTSEREYLMNLMNLRDGKDVYGKIPQEENSWSDETKSENSFGVARESDSFDLDFQAPDRKREKGANESSEDFSDGTDTETYTKEPAPNDLDDAVYYHVNRAEISPYAPPSFVPIDKEFVESTNAEEEKEDGSTASSPRVVLEAEIQFAKNKAITMKVMEDGKDGSANNNEIDVRSGSEKRFVSEDGDLIMKVLRNSEEVEEEEKTRTPRRVRFGGEVIKLRTPDSDTTDITIEIHEADDEPGPRKSPVRELITIRQEKKELQKEEEEPETEELEALPSHIPLPVAPAAKTPPGPRDPSPCRKAEAPKPPAENCLSPKSDSFDSVPSSSGSETDAKEKFGGDEASNFWQWADTRMVEENIVKDLKNKENWKIQYQALEQLKVVLINPKTIEKLEKAKNHDLLSSLFKCLLYKLPQSNNQQVTALSLSIVSQLVETLPKEVILLFVEDIVQGLCRYVGGCKNLNLKIESVQSLKMMFGVLEPSRIIDVLTGEGCLFSSSSKLRENSLLAIMYATMTFPSDYFDMDKILEKVAESTADVRRRVRHASLEAIAILSQFCSSKTLAENIGRVSEKVSTPAAKAQLIAAVQARLSRRLLPTISNEGLVLYALQIPASRRFGNMGNPMGADVDWILSGTGSVSTGSAKSKSQLNAAQRLELKQAAPLSPNKWAQSERPAKVQPLPVTKSTQAENPWTIQKNRTQFSTGEPSPAPATRFYKAQSAGNLYEEKPPETLKSNDKLIGENPRDVLAFNFSNMDNTLRPEEITWALVPISALTGDSYSTPTTPALSGSVLCRKRKMLLCRVVGYRPFVFASYKEEPHAGRERSNSLWGESVGDSQGHYLMPSFGPLRPMYLKLQPSHEQLILSRSTDDVRRNSYTCDVRKGSDRLSQEDFTEIRLLTPTILREKNASDYQNGKISKNEGSFRGSGETTTRIPVLNNRNVQRAPRSTGAYGNDRKISDGEENPAQTQKPGIVPNGFAAAPAFLPSIHATQNDNGYNIQKSPVANKFGEVDELKLQDTMSQLSGLLTTSKGTNKPGNRDFYSAKNQPADVETISNRNDFVESEILFEDKFQNSRFERSYLRNQDTLPNTVASAPAVISSEGRDQIPSTSSSNSTDFGTLSGSELRLRRLTNGSGALDNGLPYRNYNTYNPKLRGKKTSLVKNSNKVGMNGNPFPENLKPFDRPKEGLDTCANQLDSQQWEVNMLGLTSLVRLLRHHPAIVLGQLHPIIVALGRQIRNLRSQVARAACQASAEMFLVLKRNVEPDLDELSGSLFHRSADTNRFIRADCNHALDNMADNVGYAKAVSVIISKGTTHQNATVRTVAARLLLKLSEKVGPEKLLSLPKDSRDKMLQAGANLLTEGKLETRAFAKQVFRVWSSHPSFSNLILEAVPPNVMRSISKTLISLKS